MRAFLYALIVGMTLAMSWAAPAAAQSHTLTTATGYKLEYAVRGENADGPIALIIMHGKNSTPDTILNRMTRWAERVAWEAGVRVYVPVMPWSARWDGTHEDATAAIDALVELAAKDGKKVVVGGHSMGAMFTILYRSSGLPPAVVGKFVSAPGHMLDMIPSHADFWADIHPSLARAKALVADGKSKEKTPFGGRNVTGNQNINESYVMTPEVYLSWHDPQRLPSHSRALREAAVPVLWTVGRNDPLARNNASESTFRMMPAHPKSSFVLLDGKDHSSSFVASTEHLLPWLKTLAAP